MSISQLIKNNRFQPSIPLTFPRTSAMMQILLNFDEKGSPSTEKRGVIDVVNIDGWFPEVLS